MPTSIKRYQKWYRNAANIHEKSIPERNKKRGLKTESRKSKNTKKMPQKWDPQTEYIFGEIPLGAPLVVQAVSVMKKLAPSAPKARPRTKHKPK